jgi:hypothetical protein
VRNTAASIKDRLLSIARHEGIPFQRILTLYKQEGLLHRMVSTQLASSIVLKGGLLFFQLQGMIARPTKDIDLLESSDRREEALLQNLLDASSTVKIEDGLTFDRSSIDVASIAGQTEHGGIRGHILACLGTARTRIQIDMGFGDVVTGGPVERPYRTLLGNRSFSILTYSDETMAAEKIDAIVSLGIVNSRYKDLYDLFTLLVNTGISEGAVIEATSNTFSQRQTSLPEKPESLSPRHWDSTAFNAEWSRFLKRIDADSPELSLLQEELLPRLLYIYSAARTRVLTQ